MLVNDRFVKRIIDLLTKSLVTLLYENVLKRDQTRQITDEQSWSKVLDIFRSDEFLTFFIREPLLYLYIFQILAIIKPIGTNL